MRLYQPQRKAYNESGVSRRVVFFPIRYSDCIEGIFSNANATLAMVAAVVIDKKQKCGMDSRNGTSVTGRELLGLHGKLVDTPDAFARKQLLCKVASAAGLCGHSATGIAKTRISSQWHPAGVSSHGCSPESIPSRHQVVWFRDRG